MNFLFYLFSSFALASGVMVIGSRNPVHSVLFLILVFLNGAGLLVLLELDFFGMIFIVVYVGAIAVLFLFVVMMLNVRLTEMNERRLRYLPIGGLLGFLFLAEVFLIVDNDLIPPLSSRDLSFSREVFGEGSWGSLWDGGGSSLPVYTSPTKKLSYPDLHWTGWSQLYQSITPIEAVGELIYTYYFFLFLLASLILLVAMIGAIVLTLHKGVLVKRQEVFQQNTREFGKTIAKM
jgi:NADH-ubiquinone oxidoreductase chain 6